MDDCDIQTGSCAGCPPLTFGANCERCVENSFTNGSGSCMVCPDASMSHASLLHIHCHDSPVDVIPLGVLHAIRRLGNVSAKMESEENSAVSAQAHTSTCPLLAAQVVIVGWEALTAAVTSRGNATVR